MREEEEFDEEGANDETKGIGEEKATTTEIIPASKKSFHISFPFKTLWTECLHLDSSLIHSLSKFQNGSQLA